MISNKETRKTSLKQMNRQTKEYCQFFFFFLSIISDMIQYDKLLQSIFLLEQRLLLYCRHFSNQQGDLGDLLTADILTYRVIYLSISSSSRKGSELCNNL
jgi:hypothetical protein